MTGHPPAKPPGSDSSTVVPSSDWRAAVAATGGSIDPNGHSREVVMLLVDMSSSMSGPLLMQARRGARNFAQECGQSGRAVGLIGFGSEPVLLQPPCRDPALVEQALPEHASGSTAMHLAIDLAVRQLQPPLRGHALCVVTDGEPDDEEAALAAGARAKALGIDIITIGVEGANAAFLAKLASRSGLAARSSMKSLAGDMKGLARLLLSR